MTEYCTSDAITADLSRPRLVQIRRPPNDLAATLRGLADQAESGEITGAVVACIANGNYEFVYASSLSDGIVLSAMLHQNCIDRMRR